MIMGDVGDTITEEDDDEKEGEDGPAGVADDEIIDAQREVIARNLCKDLFCLALYEYASFLTPCDIIHYSLLLFESFV